MKWKHEPNSVDFEEAGLRCALRRNRSRAWCGYVAVPVGHPLCGKQYGERVKAPEVRVERTGVEVGIIPLFCASLSEDERAAMRLEGLCRHASTHAAGVVISPESLTTYMPLYKNPVDGTITSQFDMNAIEKIGLLKFDFLGLKDSYGD